MKWLKETSATGFLRRPAEPNVRRQDFPTERLLCTDCEQIFSRVEKRFAEEVFLPLHAPEGQPATFQYDGWLLGFAISLAWRSVVTHDMASFDMDPRLKDAVEVAKEQWRSFLAGETDDPGPSEHHVFFLDVIADSTGPVPDGTHAYLLRSIDTTMAFTKRSIGVYTKLPRVILWASVEPAHADGWEGTLIGRQGTLSSPQQMTDTAFGEFVFDRAQKAVGMMAGMLARQKQTIDRAIRVDPDRVLASRTFEALMADRSLRETEDS